MKIGLPAGTPDVSSILDISNTGSLIPKGFLGPQVALISNNQPDPITTPATGLIVYNTATSGTSPNNVAPGYYYWNGSLWVLFAISTYSAPVVSNNIYGIDGTLSGNRTVGLGGNFLNLTGGNVGINNANPTARLDVTGTGKFSSDVLINGITVGLGGTSAVNNTIFGNNSGLGNTTGTFNTYSGFNTGKGNTTGSFNVGAGATALKGNTTGANNAVFGYGGMLANTTGYQNVAIGAGAGAVNTTGFGNVFLGYQAGNTETGSNKLYVQNITTTTPLLYGNFGTNLLGVGFTAPQTTLHSAGAISSGIPLGGLGGAVPTNGILKLYNASNINAVSIKGGATSASYTITLPTALPLSNQLIISDALGNLSFVDNGAYSWSKVGNTGTTDLDNFIGTLDNIPLNFRVNNAKAGRIDITTQSTHLGYLAGNATTGVENTSIGANSQKSNTTGSFNFSGGVNALLNNSTGANNVSAGYNSLQLNTTGYLNTAVGSAAGFSNVTGFGNVFLGNSAGYNETGNNKLYIANSASVTPIIYGDFGTNNLGIGFTAPQSTLHTSGKLSIGLPLGGLGGAPAMDGAIDLYNATNANIFTLKPAITTGSYSLTFPPAQSAPNQILINDGTGILSWVTRGLTTWSNTGNADVIDGTNFIGTTTNVPFTIKVNNLRGGRIEPASNNTYYGYQTGASTTGTNNTSIGSSVMPGNTTGANNAAFGFKSLNANTTGSLNFGGGASTLLTNTTGYNNTVVGANSGGGIVTGFNNTILGANVNGLLGTLSNSIIIADGAGNQRININATGNVGIGTNTPAAALDVSSITKGALLPRMTKAQRDVIAAPPVGSIIYQLDFIPGLRVWNGMSWMRYAELAD